VGSINQSFIERDLDLVGQWAEGQADAVDEIKSLCAGSLQSLLFSYRATEEEIEEITAQLWVDCFVGSATRLPLLMRYNGKASLKSWLGAIAVNRWLSLKRRQSVHSKVVHQLQSTTAANLHEDSLVDLELLQLIAASLKQGLADCTDEDIVLLHLVHIHDLTQREVANLWKVHESQISRRLRAAEGKVADKTLQELKKNDRHLDITWSDFIRLCESMNLLLV